MISDFSIPQNQLQDSVCLPANSPAGTVDFNPDPWVQHAAQVGKNEVTQVGRRHPRKAREAAGAGGVGDGGNAVLAPLVLNAGIVSATAQLCREKPAKSDEKPELSGEKPELSQKAEDLERFSRIKRRFDLQDVSRGLLPTERVAHCLRWRYSLNSGVGIQYVRRVERAHFSNLQTCGLIWVCPLCAAKISERRRQELTAGTDFWRDLGHSVFLVTFTMRHDAADSLADLLRDMNGAYRIVRAGRFWQRFEKRFRLAGSVAAHEITYGQASGFHPHKHILFFSREKLTRLEEFEIWFILTHRWQSKLAEFGRDASDLVGVDVQCGYGDVSEYVTKWGLVEEVTKAPSKQGKSKNVAKHFSPFQLLDQVRNGSSWAGPVFQDYARSTKGKNQLTWSPGLHDLLGLGQEMSDQEVAEKQEEQAETLCTLLWPEWQLVLKARARAMLLEVAGTGQKDLVIAYLVAIGVYSAEGGLNG